MNGYDSSCTLLNSGTEVTRIVGLKIVDVDNCCFSCDADIPVNIAPGESYRLDYYINSFEPGHFKGSLVLYVTDDGGFREVLISIRGECNTPLKTKKITDNPFSTR